MAVGSSYPYTVLTLDGIERESGTLRFDDSANQPSPGGSGIGVASAFAPTGLTGATQVTRYVGGVATVAPTTGTFAVGDFVISRNGKIFVCTVAGTPGTWIEPASLTYAPLASPTFTGTVAVPAAAAATSAPRLSDLSSALTITSGALPALALSSATAAQALTTRQVTFNTLITSDATNNAATCAVAISPDNVTFSTLYTVSVAAAINNLGALAVPVVASIPAAWWIKLTASRFTIASGFYY